MTESPDYTEDVFSGALYFPTMIFKTSCVGHEDLNGQLLDLIYSERERDRKGVERSNFSRLGGWHSRSNLHNDRAYDPLIKRIDQAAERISSLLGYDTRKALRIGTDVVHRKSHRAA